MNRRSAIRRMLGAVAAVAASSAPLAHRTAQGIRGVIREPGGWLAVIRQAGEIIRISPRFAAEHPRETLEILTTGRFR